MAFTHLLIMQQLPENSTDDLTNIYQETQRAAGVVFKFHRKPWVGKAFYFGWAGNKDPILAKPTVMLLNPSWPYTAS